jgi:phosphoribosylanthranilate isomerase
MNMLETPRKVNPIYNAIGRKEAKKASIILSIPLIHENFMPAQRMQSSIIVQIYEIQTLEEAEMAIASGVDHIGSVLVDEVDWKQASIKETADRVRAQGARSSLIPLFQTPETIFRVLDYYRPHIVHFCQALAGQGGSPEAVEALLSLQMAVRGRFPEIAIMRSIPIAAGCGPSWFPTLKMARLFEPVSDYFLTDTLLGPGPESADGRQPVNGFVGITGTPCDWDMARQLVAHSRIPVILAGGISPENVREAILSVEPAGVDSCTHTNALNPRGRVIRFRKDPEKIRRLVQQARLAQSELVARRAVSGATAESSSQARI